MGQSTGRPDFRLAAQVADLAAVVESASDRPVVLVGLGHAGPAAIAYAHAHPERVALLALWCTYADVGAEYFHQERVRATFRILPHDSDLFVNTLGREMLGWGFPHARRFVEMFQQGKPSPNKIALAWRQIAASDVTALLPNLRVRTIVLQREDCPAPSLATARRLAAAIPGAELAVFPGRSPIAITDRPDLVQRVMLAAADHATGAASDPGPLQRLIDDGLAATAVTPRETETLLLVAAGLSNQEIADRLVVSRATVKKDLTDSFERLGVQNRTQAVSRARELGLLP